MLRTNHLVSSEGVIRRPAIRLSDHFVTEQQRATNGPLTKIGVVGQKSDFSAQNRDFGPKKKRTLLGINHVLATPGKSCSKKKVAFSQINISLLRSFG